MWNYERVEQKFEVLPVGKYRLRVKSAEKAMSKNGKDMLVLTFEVNGSNQTLRYYIVFLPDNPEITNRNLTQFFDSFGIEDKQFKLASWIGKVGGCQTKLEEYNGEESAKISYFLNKKQQEGLPAWQDGARVKPTLTPVDDNEDVPF